MSGRRGTRFLLGAIRCGRGIFSLIFMILRARAHECAKGATRISDWGRDKGVGDGVSDMGRCIIIRILIAGMELQGISRNRLGLGTGLQSRTYGSDVGTFGRGWQLRSQICTWCNSE